MNKLGSWTEVDSDRTITKNKHYIQTEKPVCVGYFRMSYKLPFVSICINRLYKENL